MSVNSPSVRLLVVDDSEVVRAGLRTLLEDVPGLKVVAQAGNGSGAVEAFLRHKPDVVLLDINLPDGTGIDVCRRILETPTPTPTRVLFLTSTADERVVNDAIRAGAHGYLLKEINARALVQAIRDVAAGKSILDPAVTARVMALMRGGPAGKPGALSSLSAQETKVLALIAEGLTNKEIGERLGLTEKTVKNYLSNVFEKLEVSRRAQAAALFVQRKN